MQEMQVQSLSQEDPLEEEMATHSSVLAWRIPRTQEPGRPQSMGSQRVRHDWATITHSEDSAGASLVAQWWRICLQCRRHMRCCFDPWLGKIPCRSTWQSTPAFLPGESHGQREEPGVLQSMGSQRVRHNWVIEHTGACTHTHTHTHTQNSPTQPASCSIHQGGCQPLEQNWGEVLSSDSQGSSESASHRHVTSPQGKLRLLPSYVGKDAEC